MEINKEYDFIKIENWAQENQFDLKEYGPNRIGENFIALKNEFHAPSHVAGFVLTGKNANGFIYKCVYKDF